MKGEKRAPGKLNLRTLDFFKVSLLFWIMSSKTHLPQTGFCELCSARYQAHGVGHPRSSAEPDRKAKILWLVHCFAFSSGGLAFASGVDVRKAEAQGWAVKRP